MSGFNEGLPSVAFLGFLKGGGNFKKMRLTIYLDSQKKCIALRAHITHSLLPKNHLPKRGSSPKLFEKSKRGGPSPNNPSSKFATGFHVYRLVKLVWVETLHVSKSHNDAWYILYNIILATFVISIGPIDSFQYE